MADNLKYARAIVDTWLVLSPPSLSRAMLIEIIAEALNAKDFDMFAEWASKRLKKEAAE